MRTQSGGASNGDPRETLTHAAAVDSGSPSGSMRVLVIGSGPAAPQPDTPGSGLLVRSGPDALMLDCGPGTMSRLRATLDPRSLSGIIISHFHADHYLDLVALRYLFPWKGPVSRRMPVHLPPGGRERLAALAEVISERPEFFSEAFDMREYDPDAELCVGNLRVTFVESRHYVPAYGALVESPDGGRLVYSSDTGPNPGLVDAARGADLLVVEATLGSVEEDVAERGHLTLDEAVDHAARAGVGRVLVTHCPVERREEVRARDGEEGRTLYAAVPGLEVTVSEDAQRLARATAAWRRDGPCIEPAPGVRLTDEPGGRDD